MLINLLIGFVVRYLYKAVCVVDEYVDKYINVVSCSAHVIDF